MKKYTWLVEFTVDETWVEDGFNLTDERAHLMIQKDLAYAYPSETSAKVLKAPGHESIHHAQGYPNDRDPECTECKVA